LLKQYSVIEYHRNKGALIMRMNMRPVGTIILVFGMMASTAFAQRVVKGGEPPFPPQHGTASLTLDVNPDVDPDSIEKLADQSLVIVEGYVQAVFPPWIWERSFKTDAMILVTRVLKGSLSGVQVVVSQNGGIMGEVKILPTQYSLMQAGEHYFLFLTNDSRTYAPTHAGIPRYLIAGGGVAGTVRVDGKTIHVSEGTRDVFRNKYEGASFDEALTAVTRHVQAGKPQ
jgi:hypothetical protein